MARVLDVGAMGLMVPMVESRQQAQRIADACRYSPVGRRGAAFTVAHDDYTGGDVAGKMTSANENVLLIAQIENHFVFPVAAGKLKPGERLPPARELGERLGINPNTAGKAYQNLKVMRVIVGSSGRGYSVAEDAGAQCREGCYRDVIQRLHESIQEAKAAGISKVVLSKALGVSYESKGGIYEPAPKSVLAVVKRVRK